MKTFTLGGINISLQLRSSGCFPTALLTDLDIVPGNSVRGGLSTNQGGQIWIIAGGHFLVVNYRRLFKGY